MKKLILTMAIAVSSLVSFANREDVNLVVRKSFEKEFAGASDVQWTSAGSNYKASFVYNNQYVFAFFTAQGELMGITRNLTSLELPVPLQSGLKKDYREYWISNLFEVSNQDGTHYYITLEKADSKVILSSEGTDWKLYKKATKI
ncbi:MAG: hypothetical protein EOO09_11355 [Chitinophagaceae bacterium]|nr:MAG: hypothetical protein EOO09_11355 [Chitinophagaceae bacterium]